MTRLPAPLGALRVAGVWIRRSSSRRTFANISGMLERMDGTTNIISTDKYGFNVNGIFMRGSVIAFSNFTLLWNCLRVAEASPRNLAIVHSVRPKPEVLIIGTGEKLENINPALYGYFSRKGISIESMSTINAISTFNVLVSEGRPAAAALVCRTPMTREDASMYTPEALQLATAKHERALAEALSGRATELALGGPIGEPQRLLDDGVQRHDGSVGIASQQPQGGSQSNAVQPTPLIMPKVTDSGMRAVEAQSLTVATQYGYPGALPPDISPLAGRTQVKPGASVQPRTADEMLDAMARKGGRKSGVQPPPGTATHGSGRK